MLKPYLNKVVSGENLTAEEAQEAMAIVMGGQATPAQIGGYLVALRMKGETVDEIAGSAKAMRSVVEEVPIQDNSEPLLDTCGTGGDGSHSFNISTAAAFVIAGTGHRVAKHGNRAASSSCGSADVLAALGLNLDLTPKQVGECIDEVGIGFMFAPRFHPAMKHAIGPRKELGLRTIFNILGPLTNPARATHQLLGVYDPALTEPMADALGNLGLESAMVVHGHGGLDELTTSGPNTVSELIDGQVRNYQLDPAQFGLDQQLNGDLLGGGPGANAERMKKLLTNQDDTGLTEVVVLNAAAGLSLLHHDLELGIKEASHSLESGAAYQKLLDLVSLSRQFASDGAG
ncbi:MAG: anthranilate phosphoribosyltransferase [Anaerolineales bacterium]|nr:anthranilate phosphoribosyltransferase [Anaerolineales bacterium]